MQNRLFSLIRSLAFFAFSCAAMAQSVVISEFMADNLTSNYRDEDGERQDWLEIENISGVTQNLNGWYLTDDAGDLRQWRFPVTSPAVNLAPGARLVIWCSGKDRKANASRLHTKFKLDKDGEYLALVRPDGVTVEHSYGPMYPPQIVNGAYGRTVEYATQILLPETAPGRAHVPTSANDYTVTMAGWNSSATFDDTTWQAGESGFGFGSPFTGLLGAGGDLTAQMQNINSSACIRFKFELPNPAVAAAVRLKIKYDDGFVAFLNGTKIGSGLAPTEALAWNSTNLLSIDRPDGSASTFETASTPNALGSLVAGTNVLAFQLLNRSATDTNTLLRPQFEIDVATGITTGYLVSATPGAANSAIATAIGPAISDVTDDPARPAGGAGSPPIRITARVTPTLRPLAASNPVVLKWRRMQLSETSINMSFDPASGLYFADMPTSSLLPGEMIRWRIEARDNGSPVTYSYAPEYPFSATSPPSNPAPNVTVDLDQYYGTVAQDTITTSNLPILHMFAPTLANADNAGTDSCSIFFQPLPLHPAGTPGYTPPGPQFYDNIPISRHGQSSSGFPQRSYNLSLNKDNRFEWKDGEPRLRAFNLLSTYADKSKVRHSLAYYVWEKSGHMASHFAQTLRVQLNGSFRGLYDMVEDGNEDFLEREGLDPLGSLYKVYNSLENANVASNNGGGSEKKNPDTTDFSDLQAFVDGISSGRSMSDRLRYSFDNVDIPSLINFCAVHTLIMNRDTGHKNYYVFRDTRDTGEWSALPWDQDLSFGHTWTSPNPGASYFDDHIHSQGPLQLGTGNRLMQIVWGSPELNAMFVARMRSLANQFYVSSTETNGPLEQKVNELLNLIDPNPGNPATGTDDADLYVRQWGFWVHGSSASIPYTDSRVDDHTPRAHALRILSLNPNPPYPSANPWAGFADNSNSIPAFLPGRREFLYKTPPAQSGSMPLPATAPANPNLIIEGIDFKPAGGTQDQEFFIIRNPNNYAVDLSGWTITGEVEMTFRAGTVIPAVGATTTQGTNSSYVNQLIVAKKPLGFRQRTASPRSNEFRFVTGPYNGQLSSRGGSIVLSRPNDLFNPAAGYTQIASATYNPAPTPSQQFLRITELNYAPAAPTTDESNALVGVSRSDFEFIEIMNTGATTLNLAGARFERGVDFVFPNLPVSTLAPGDRRLVVSNLTAFRVRYGTGYDALILGEYLGNLSNDGEEIQLVDPVGEVVLEFDYDPTWYPLTAGPGRSLEIVDMTHTAYGTAAAWRASYGSGGSPTYEDVAAQIQDHPDSQTVNPDADVTLSVTATGVPTPTFQWRHNGFAIPGANSPTLLLSDITEDAQGDYEVQVTNAAASVTSTVATITVNDPVVITEHPTPKTVNPATLVTFNVAATGTGPLTYQWRRNEQPIENATNATLEFSAQEANQGSYDVIVTNVVGSVPSNAVALSVNDPVVFVQHPQGGGFNPGTTVELTATVTGTGPFAYQWRKNLQPLENGTGATLSFSAEEANEGSYDVMITNVVGTVPSNAAAVSVNDPIVFQQQPTGGTFNPGATVTLSVVVSGSGPITYSWRKGNSPVAGGDEASLVLTASEAIEGNYHVVVTNPVDSYTSNTVSVAVNDPVVITNQPKAVAVQLGGAASFSVTATGTGPLTYQWRKGGQPIATATSSTYSIASVTENDLGSYDVLVSNVVDVNGVASTPAQLSIVDWVAAAGAYQGLLAGPDLSNPAADPRPGRATVTVAKGGKFTGKLEYRGVAYSFRGVFDVNLKGSASIKRRTSTIPLTLAVELDQPENEARVTVTDNAANPVFEPTATLAHIPVRPRTAPALKTGRYTLLLEAGTGAPVNLNAPGYMMLNVAKNGATSWTGKVPDGTAFRGSALLAADDTIAFYSPIYPSRTVGTFAGPVAIVGTAISGNLAWQKPPQLKGIFWPAGISALVTAEGGLFVPPARNAQVISAPALQLTLAGPMPNNGMVALPTLTLKNTFTFPAPNAEKLKLTVNKTTGALTGSFYDAGLRKTRKLEGVLLQQDKTGAGFFLGADAVGEWELAEP